MKMLRILYIALSMVFTLDSLAQGFGYVPGPNGGFVFVNPRIQPPARPPLPPLPPILRPGEKKPPIFELGDWNSSGAPEFPYDPQYPFQYTCQVQLTDRIQRQVSAATGAKNYRFYAVAEFQLNNQKASVSTRDLEWFGKKFFSNSEILDTDEVMPFAIEDNRIGIRFRPNQNPEMDTLFLHANLEQKIRGLVISNSKSVTTSRQSSRFSVSVDLDFESTSDQTIPRMSMRVLCTKEK